MSWKWYQAASDYVTVFLELLRCGVLFYRHYFCVHSDLEYLYQLGSHPSNRTVQTFTKGFYYKLFETIHLCENHFGPVGWDCCIHRLHLCRKVRAPDKFPGYETKNCDGEAPVMLELRGMRIEHLLPLLQGLLWPGVVAPERVLPNRTKLCTYAKLNCLK